jgi:hypothetical protein
LTGGNTDRWKISKGKFKGDAACAKKLGKGESDVRSITETFRRNPRRVASGGRADHVVWPDVTYRDLYVHHFGDIREWAPAKKGAEDVAAAFVRDYLTQRRKEMLK